MERQDFDERIRALSSADDFLRYFELPYEERVVHVHRLHILKRFHQYLRREPEASGGSPAEAFRRHRELLQRAYEDFVHSTAAQEKVFKVFQDAGGTRHVGLDALRGSLPAGRATSGPAGAAG